jgi:hypothetical protein
MPPVLRLLTRPLRAMATWLLALVVVFEEWGWEPLQRALGVLARLPLFAWLERRVAALPPWGALTVFAVPSVALLPVKLLALGLIGQGQAALGVAVIVGAKLAGTALVARLFVLTRPQLMRLAWFAALYTRWAAYKAQLLALVRASAAWRAARAIRARVRRLVRSGR